MRFKRAGVPSLATRSFAASTPHCANLHPDVRALNCPRREENQKLVAIPGGFHDTLLEIISDFDISLIKERRGSARLDVTRDLTGDPSINR